MKTVKFICTWISILSTILIIAWSLVVYFHGENTTQQEQFEIAKPIFRGSIIAILLCLVLLLILWLLPKRKNLSNS
jgi:type VI protein secretion system component VasK